MLVKICGMKEPENILAVAGLHPDMMGFIFYPASPRYAGGLRSEDTLVLPENIQKTGVFVNEKPDRILVIAEKYRLDVVQLHGDESVACCEKLRLAGLQVIKAFGISESRDFRKVSAYEGKCDWLLFDTRIRTAYGGTGKSFDWNLLSDYRGEIPFLLSGGIASSDVCKIRQIRHPAFAGVDLNSCFETVPGIKDVVRLAQFMKCLFN